MKARWLVALGSVAFLLTLALHAPVNLLYAAAQRAERPGPVRFYGLHGTVSSGGFSAIALGNRPVLGEGRWTLRPEWLPLLHLAADVETDGDLVLRARLSRSPFGSLRASDVSAAGSARALLQLAGQPALPVEGQARLELALLRIDGGTPVEAYGSVEVQGLTWTLARNPLALGSFNAALTTDAQGILASFGSGPGPLELGGTALLKADRGYTLDLQLRPRPEAPESLLTLVRSLGPADGQGWHHLRRQGELP